MDAAPCASSTMSSTQIKLSKELEHVLATGWNAEGKGLHERLNVIQASGQPVPDQLVSVTSIHVDKLWMHNRELPLSSFSGEQEKTIRYVATIRNKLIHQHDFNSIPDRGRFIVAYEVRKDSDLDRHTKLKLKAADDHAPYMSAFSHAGLQG